jgi:alcohol dehydrogenase (cytochrome c)
MRITPLRLVLALAMVLGGGLFLAVRSNEDLRWRVNVVAMKAAGKFPEIGWQELTPMLRPGSGFWLESLTRSPNVYAAVRSPFASNHDIATGRALFRLQCVICHGVAGQGGTAPALVGRELSAGSSDWAIFRTIRHGVPGTPMQAHDLPDGDIWRLVSYIQELGNKQRAAESAGSNLENLPMLGVSSDALKKATDAATDWPTYYGSYNGHRYSDLLGINLNTISKLQAQWIYQLPTKGARIQATPIAVAGRLFVTDPQGSVFALDSRTGAPLWHFLRAASHEVPLCCVTANRGVAVLDDRVFVATIDAHLIALDGKSGRLIWDKTIVDYRSGYSSTGAPLIVKNMVITGIAGSEFGAPGFISAYDIRSGDLVWRFNTIPRPGEKGNETWAGDSWKTGGASSWMTGTYDPQLDLVYWGIANPAPDYDASLRPGDNLYSNSVVALHADTGKLAWHFQYTPGDDHDWDSVQTQMLADVQFGGKTRQLLITANRNGFYYVLDRKTGQFLHASPYVKQTWADHIDSNGRPVRRPEAAPTERGVILYPGGTGGTNWWPPTYSPLARLFIVPALERPGIFFKTRLGERREGERLLGGSSSGTSTSQFTAIRALDPTTGSLQWEHRSPVSNDNGDLSGLLSTAGGLVFGSDRTRLIALDITTGREVWSFEAGGKIYSPPVSYVAGNSQYIAFAAGDIVVALALPQAAATTHSN